MAALAGLAGLVVKAWMTALRGVCLLAGLKVIEAGLVGVTTVVGVTTSVGVTTVVGSPLWLGCTRGVCVFRFFYWVFSLVSCVFAWAW